MSYRRNLREQPLNARERAQLAEGARNGMSLREISNASGVCRSSVRRIVLAEGVTLSQIKVPDAVRVLVLVPGRDMQRIRGRAGRRGVNRWIRAAIREALS